MSWQKISLGDAVKQDGGILQTGPFGSQLKQSEYAVEGVPVIMPKDIRNGEVIQKEVARVPEATAERLARHRVSEGGVVLPRRGEVSKRAFIRSDQAGWICGTGCLKIEVNGVKVWPRFLYYYLALPSSVDWLLQNAVGSTMLNLSAEIVSRFPLHLPSIDVQKKLADNLSSYDEAIENNQRRIQLLEESARLLYREWFVHLHFPGHEHVKVTNGVPEGWEPCLLPQVIEVNPKEKIEKGKEIVYVPMSALSETNMTVDTSKFEQRTKHTNVKFRQHDVLLARITPCLENGKTGYVHFLKEDEQACGSTEFIVLRGKRVSSAFTYCLARSEHFRETAIQSMTGSSGRQRVQASSLADYTVPLPPQHLLEMFDEVAMQALEQIGVLMAQNERLAKARDLLLPKLMSGELAA